MPFLDTFEPIKVKLKLLSIKTILLIALTSARRVSDLQAFSVCPSGLQLASRQAKACPRPNPTFVPKVTKSLYRCPILELLAFSSEEVKRLHTQMLKRGQLDLGELLLLLSPGLPLIRVSLCPVRVHHSFLVEGYGVRWLMQCGSALYQLCKGNMRIPGFLEAKP